MPGAKVISLCTSGAGGAADRAADTIIGTAAANVSRHVLCDFVVRGMRCLCEERRSCHDLSTLAISALRNVFGDPRLLQGMQASFSESLDGLDVLSRGLRDLHGARAGQRAIDVNAARSAKPCTAPELRARQLQSVAQHPEQGSVRRNIHCFLVAVYLQSESCHWRSLEAGNILAQMEKKENRGQRIARCGRLLHFLQLR